MRIIGVSSDSVADLRSVECVLLVVVLVVIPYWLSCYLEVWFGVSPNSCLTAPVYCLCLPYQSDLGSLGTRLAQKLLGACCGRVDGGLLLSICSTITTVLSLRNRAL